MNHNENNRTRIMNLMNRIEMKRNGQHEKNMTFEEAYPELTKKIWDTLDNNKRLFPIIETLHKLSDSLDAITPKIEIIVVNSKNPFGLRVK